MRVPELDGLVSLGRMSLRDRVRRLWSKHWHITQCAVAAGVAWYIASEMLGHHKPFFAPIAAVISLGTSYGQRLRRVAEVTLGVAMGVFAADVLVRWIGPGWWQLIVIVGLAMSVAFLLDAGQLFVTQAAVQSIVVTVLLPAHPGAAFTRWTDALVGGAVALVAATLVPAAPLRRPREQAAVVADKVAHLLRAAAEVMRHGQAQPALALLADARATDHLIRELQDAAEEGISVVASSPFRIRHRSDLRRMSELVEPLDRALRSTRVLVRQTAVAAYHQVPVPSSYADLADALGECCDVISAALAANHRADGARHPLIVVGEMSGRVERSRQLAAEVILAQLRSIVADLLMVSGMGQLEASDAIPPPPEQSPPGRGRG